MKLAEALTDRAEIAQESLDHLRPLRRYRHIVRQQPQHLSAGLEQKTDIGIVGDGFAARLQDRLAGRFDKFLCRTDGKARVIIDSRPQPIKLPMQFRYVEIGRSLFACGPTIPG